MVEYCSSLLSRKCREKISLSET